MEEAQRVRLHELAAVQQLAQHAAVSGMRTAMMASQAFEEASRWLTGQMPQMRAVMDGHLVERPALGEFLEAAHLGHVQLRAVDLALVVELDRDFGVAFDAGNGGSIVMSSWLRSCSSCRT